MMVHGSWSYGIQESQGGDFVKSGGLGYMNFPPVEGGKGDPSNQVGNPGHYLAISSKASPEAKEVAKKFFSTVLIDDKEPAEWIKTGNVPIIKGSESLYEANPKASSSSSSRTPRSTPRSSPSPGTSAEPDRGRDPAGQHREVLPGQVSPQQWIDNMNAVIGK